MIGAIACAKINLSLRVGSLGPDGLHRIDGLFQSISLVDRLRLAPADTDSIVNPRGGQVIGGWENLAWRALAGVRSRAERTDAVEIVLEKLIPAAAGLGGGSADAAAALAAASRIFDIEGSALIDLAVSLGSDVPFCYHGGLARVAGTGEVLSPLPTATGYAVAVVTPPIELATGAVYGAWDRLGGPAGPRIGDAGLPPSLRELGPMANDLFPAAIAVAPSLDDWRADLTDRWSRPVLLTGSGPTLFAFFVDQAEATEALSGIPGGARAAEAAVPVPFGWALSNDGRVDASQPISNATASLATALLSGLA